MSTTTTVPDTICQRTVWAGITPSPKTCLKTSDIFVELLNVINNMLIYNKIYSQQILNKRKGVLKRKAKRHTITALLFLFVFKCFVNGFVERLLRAYITGHQCVICHHQQFNTFSTSTSLPGEATEVNTAIRRLVGRISVLPTDKGKTMLLAKRKGRPISANITADTAAGFWTTKSHSSLGRFLHAPLRSC